MVRNAWVSMLVILLSASSVVAQEPVQAAPPSDAQVLVTIGDTTAPPNWELRVPVSVKLVPGAEVGRLSLRVTYPAKTLTYQAVHATDTLKGAGFDVTAEKPTVAGDAGVVTLTLQPADKKLKALTAGVVTIVVFKVANSAEESKTWPLAAQDVKAEGLAANGPELKAAADRPGKLFIAPAGLPIFGCFMYMH